MRPDTLVFPGMTKDPYIHWMGKGGSLDMEWVFRFYSQQSSRPNRISAYLFNPEGGLGAGAYFEDLVRPGEWMHIVGCFDPGDQNNPQAGVSIYKNGQFRGGPTTQQGALYHSYNIQSRRGGAPVRFGTNTGDYALKGALDEVAIYPRVLTAAEILKNYNVGSGG